MSRLSVWWRRLVLLLRRDRATAELEAEIRLHRELRAATLRKDGASPADAGFASARLLGNAGSLVERSRDAWGFAAVDDLRQDIRLAWRRLRQRAGYTGAVVITLALGIGATTAMFSALDAAMLRPLPFPHPERLGVLTAVRTPFRPTPRTLDRMLDITDAADLGGVFSHVAAYASGGLNLDDRDHPLHINVGLATVDFFHTVGVIPQVGRGFATEDGLPSSARVVVLSWSLWQREYGGRQMLGQSIVMNHQSYAVVGVMPRGFAFPDQSDAWVPMSIPISAATFEASHTALITTVIARVSDSVTVERASVLLRLRWEQALLAQPKGTHQPSMLSRYVDDVHRLGAFVPLQATLGANRVTAVKLLFAMTALLLLIACANVTNLMLGQATMRAREIGVRQMLGARRGRLIRQLLTESVILSLGGALLGIALAPIAVGFLRQLLPPELLTVSPVRIDARVLAFATVLALVTGVGAGWWPAVRTSVDTTHANLAGNRSATARRSGALRRLLVGVEIALTTLLLVGAGLLLHSFQNVARTDRGLRTAHVIAAHLAYPRWEDNPRGRLVKMRAIADRLEAIPGIAAVGFANDLAFVDRGILMSFIIVDSVPGTLQPAEGSHWMMVSGGYFPALGIPIIQGRTFTMADDSAAPPVAIVDRSTARKYFPNGDALGHLISLGGNDPPATIVGVAADVLDEEPGRDSRIPQLYFPLAATPPASVSLVARGALTDRQLQSAVLTAVRSVDRTQPVYDIRMMQDVVHDSGAPRRTNMELMTLFAVLALALAAFGTYAVISQAAAQRQREFGIRAALGAQRGDLILLASHELAWVVAVGITVGLGVSWMAARAAATMLYHVAPHDLPTFAAVLAVLVTVALVATLAPAIRAARANPADVIRTE